MEIRYSTAE